MLIKNGEGGNLHKISETLGRAECVRTIEREVMLSVAAEAAET
jgi:hypothetical protein